ncbi:MarR family transcriptional regulator [Streptomyces gardneri]|uniref:MarR family winged helix-turn-helix transcriptional regulator n=1 Tax=Nocardia TaxID=1817 RepID=UPI00135A4973|nr:MULTISPECIES: MarR family transcriptional regulator [Nocardia]MBF6168367.1 MarR family transcriptional regulator [Streptomyces gardneri]MBF6205861.1 MarR family transcriptional regulator [Streptomyces gardneri]UAK32203.1 MarR family transcriptional regulator [Nocardia asteroides]
MHIAHEGAARRLRVLPTRLVNQVALVANRATERALEPTGSRRHHYALLATLGEFGPDSQAELGRRTRIDRSDVVAAVNDLAARGFVERSPDPADRRRNIVTLTAAGARHLEELHERLALAQDELLAGFTERDRRTLVTLLTRILDAHSG